MGLHSATHCSVTLRACDGDLRITQRERSATLSELVVCRADHGVQVRTADNRLCVDLVEHLFAALAGLGVRRGLEIVVDGEEVPLLDGTALPWVNALGELGLPRTPPGLRVMRAARYDVDGSVYAFEPLRSTGDDAARYAATRVTVHVEFSELARREQASWDGRGDTFGGIASARTFGFARDASRLRAAGRARHVDPKAVMVFDDDGRVLPPGTPPRPGELARHKLLDLVGDAYLFGGPPLGELRTERPGHARTHRAFRLALQDGVLGSGRCA